MVAIDPGSAKCGVVMMRADTFVLHRAIVPTEETVTQVQNLFAKYRIYALIVGNGTGSKPVLNALREAKFPAPLEVVEEYRTSEEARKRYVAENPARGWQRLLPRSLRTPPEPYDDYVAVILAERWWKAKKETER